MERRKKRRRKKRWRGGGRRGGEEEDSSIMVFVCISNIKSERVESNVQAGRREHKVGKLCTTTSTQLHTSCHRIGCKH